MKGIVSELARLYDRFLFESCDPRIASCLRVGFGILLIPYIGIWMADGARWFSDEGVLQSATAEKLGPHLKWSLLFFLPSTPMVVQSCLILLLGHTFLLLVGCWSRLQAAAIFLWLTSFQHRNPLICDGEDTVFRLFALFMIFMPLDHQWSFLRYLRRQEKPPLDRSKAWGLRLIQLEMTFLYLSTAWSKMEGETWQNGTALYYVSRMSDLFGKPWVPIAIFDQPWLVAAMTWGVLFVEFALPISLWIPRLRSFAILVGLGLHLSIELSMHLFLFQWIMMLGLLSFTKYPKSLPE